MKYSSLILYGISKNPKRVLFVFLVILINKDFFLLFLERFHNFITFIFIKIKK
jgi:hypothetical protein